MTIKIRVKLSLLGMCIWIATELLLLLLFHQLIHSVWKSYIAATVLFIGIVVLQNHRYLGDHRKGMKLLKQNMPGKALGFFEKSTQFFRQHPGPDKYRYLLLITPSAISCYEMDMINILACHVLMKQKEKAEFYYQSLLQVTREKNIALPWYDQFLDTFY